MYLVIAYLLEALIGYPKFIFAAIKHPVVWIGAVIDFFDRKFNVFQMSSRTCYGVIAGIVSMLVLLAITFLFSYFIFTYTHPLIEIICMASLLATRSLYSHVRDVEFLLAQNDISQAREKLSKIVGRDVENLDEAGISKAAIESLAESFCDGVVAPVFYGALFGLVGIACYKAVNTADSMIGHKTERHHAFGWAAARLDDVLNYIPARLSVLLIALASGSIKRSVYCAMRDGHKHASPNSGYPEAAMAGALGVCLGGARSYDGEVHNAPLIGEEFNKETGKSELKKALRIYTCACALLFIALLVLAMYQ